MKNKAYDLAAYSFSKDEPLLLDANVWLFLYSAPSDKTLAPAAGYSAAFKQMLHAGARLVLDPIVISEYLHAYCRIEFSALYQKTYGKIKAFRNSSDFATVGPKATFYAREILKLCVCHDYPFTKIDVAQMLLDVELGVMEPNDRLLVESCRHYGWKFVTHDGDCTDGGIEVLTTNPNLIVACS